jgi:hypothetical protein
MTADDIPEKPRGDRMTTDFFEDVLAAYLEADRIESAVLRLELDDGRTRRLVVDDDTESLSSHEYLARELAEAAHLLESNDDVLGDPLELSIPVGDVDRVVEEAREDGAVTTAVGPGGVATLLEQFEEITRQE